MPTVEERLKGKTGLARQAELGKISLEQQAAIVANIKEKAANAPEPPAHVQAGKSDSGDAARATSALAEPITIEHAAPAQTVAPAAITQPTPIVEEHRDDPAPVEEAHHEEGG